MRKKLDQAVSPIPHHDLFVEGAVPFREATKLIPKRRDGRATHVATIFRWASVGIRGIKLESIQLAGTKCTSKPALSRFFQRLTAQETGQPIPGRTDSQRDAAIARAEAELSHI